MVTKLLIYRDDKLVHSNWISIYLIQLDWIISIQNLFEYGCEYFKNCSIRYDMDIDIWWISKIQFIYPILSLKNLYFKTEMKKIKMKVIYYHLANSQIITSRSSLDGAHCSSAARLFSSLSLCHWGKEQAEANL